jgi:hypothetical protein
LNGQRICQYHGGNTKAAKRKAQARLDEAADRMAAQLLRLALTAENEAVQARCVDSALDRTIGKAPTTVEIGPTKPYETVFDDISAGLTREESRRRRGYLEPGQESPTGPPAGMPNADIAFDDMQSEYVRRDDPSVSYQYRADPLATEDDTLPERNGPSRQARPRHLASDRPSQPVHIVGEQALRIAAQLARQQAIESGR